MRYPGFVSGTHQSRSPLANVERTINWYPENVGDRLVLYPTAGLRTLVNTGRAPGRAMFFQNGRAFMVMGDAFQELTATNIVTGWGTVVLDNYPAQIVGNGVGNQLLVASAGNAYLFDLVTNAFTLVLTGEAHMIAMLDGYFLAFNRATGKVRFSDLNNGLVWDPLDFFLRSIAPDRWQAMIVNQGRIWLIGEQTGEVWWDAGGSSIPFAPIPSSVFNFGIVAPWSLVNVGDSVRWLSQTRDGDGIVVSARGYRPERISDHATEYAIASYRKKAQIIDCEALTYQNVGHTYTSFRFPSADATRVYDDATGLWHERATWDAPHAAWHVWRPRVHMMAFGQHLAADGETSLIAVIDDGIQTDLDGSPIRRVRIPPALHGEGERVFVDRLELFLEPGLAPQPGQPYDNPQVLLQMSYDGGKTWSNERHASAGLTGQYQRRVAWPRCGSGWTVVCKFTCSDPVPWNVIDCFLDGQGFAVPRGEAA